MKAGYIQFDVSHNKDENLKYIMQAIRNFHGDLVVLPELCMCGYLFQDRDSLWAIAEEVPVGPSTQAMTKLSEECDCVIVFGRKRRGLCLQHSGCGWKRKVSWEISKSAFV